MSTTITLKSLSEEAESISISKEESPRIIGRMGDLVPGNCQFLSREHCLIRYSAPQGWIIHDLQSYNGTFLNGRAVGSIGQILKTGDDVRLANLPFKVEVRYGVA